MSMPDSKWIYLASQSPRRRELLSQIGVAHRLLLPAPEEDAESLEVVLPGEPARSYVERVTALKLIAAHARLVRLGGEFRPILCADTTVVLDGAILGKPKDAAHALSMLRGLSGREHQVFTAIALRSEGVTLQACSESRVQFDALSEVQLHDYIASGEPFGKAGAYGVQGRAAAFIRRIEGSYSGIMGLPLFETAQALRQLGFACNKTS